MDYYRGSFRSTIKQMFASISGIFFPSDVPPLAEGESSRDANIIGNTILILSDQDDLCNGRSFSTDPNETMRSLCKLQESIIGALKIETCFPCEPSTDPERINIFSDKDKGVTIVDKVGKVQIPKGWVTLMEGERVLDSKGFVHRLTFMEHLSVCCSW